MKIGRNIDTSSGRQFVIPDIHGCYKTFKTLLKSLSLKKNDQVFLLGDYVNKGPNGHKVLDLIINWEYDSKLFPLRGNHDQMLLDYFDSDDKILRRRLIRMNSKKLVDHRSKYKKFIKSLPYYYELENFLLVHAGFDFRAPEPFEETFAMMNIRGFRYRKKPANNKKVIHGHYPKSISLIKERIDKQKNTLPLDNGCVYKRRKTQGRLTCLELKRMKLTWIENQEY